MATESTPAPAPRRRAGPLVEALRQRPWVRRAISLLSVGLLVAGLAMLGWPLVTNVYQGRVQSRLDRQLASPQLKQAYRERKVQAGDSLTRIKMSSIGVDVVVVEGTTADALRAGAGHYPQTALPCETGNVAIAGHRTTYGKPFANVDQIKTGDLIELQTPVGGCVYRVSRDPFIVNPDDLSVIAPTPGRELTLTSCHPKGSAAKRIIIRAEWVRDLRAA